MKVSKLYSKVLILLAIMMVAIAQSASPFSKQDRTGDWCSDSEEYFVENCPIQRGDYNGCCLCTQTYYYGCDCCRDVVDAIGVMGDCSQWGAPTGNDEFCYNKN